MNIEQIKIQEPNAVSFTEGKTSYIVELQDGSKVLLSKQLVEQYYKPKTCFNCGKNIIFQKGITGLEKIDPETRQSHECKTHVCSGRVERCWECGTEFCKRCMGSEGSLTECYCGC